MYRESVKNAVELDPNMLPFNEAPRTNKKSVTEHS